MARQYRIGPAARYALEAGVSLEAEIVGVTLGPKGQNVALGRKWLPPNVTHDGVTVARDVDLPDPFENMGAQLLKEAAAKTNDVAGDGTTTSTILARAMVNLGNDLIDAGANPMILRRGIERGVEKVTKYLLSQATKITTKEEAEKVATVSLGGDRELGKLVSDALSKVGKDGVVSVEGSSVLESSLDFREGMNFSTGLMIPAFAFERGKAELEKPLILVTDRRILAETDVVPLMERLVDYGKPPLVIIAPEIAGEALATLLVNRVKGSWKIVGIKAPGFAEYQKEMLQDIAILTGAKFISEAEGDQLAEVMPDQLGRANRVVSTKDSTTIIEGAGIKEDIEERVAEIRGAFEAEKEIVTKERLRGRLSRLSSGVVVLKVGAATDVELKEKYYRVEDALNATRAALEEGIVPGGETALVRAALKCFEGIPLEPTDDFSKGEMLVCRSLPMPFWTLMENSGVNPSEAVRKIITSTASTIGINVDPADKTKNYEVCDLIAVGITDPVKVTVNALQNSASVAALILTTKVLSADIPEGKEQEYQEIGLEDDPVKRRESYLKRVMPKRLDKEYRRKRAEYMSDDKKWVEDILSREIMPDKSIVRVKQRRGSIPGEIVTQPVKEY